MAIKVAFPFVGDTIGGSHISAALLMADLPKHGVIPTAIVHRDGPLRPWLNDRGIDVLRADLPVLESHTRWPQMLVGALGHTARLVEFLRRHAFQLIHLNDGRMINTWVPAARLSRMTAIAHQRTRWAPSRHLYYSLRLAHGVVSISNFVHESLPDKIKNRSVVIPNPVELVSHDRSRARDLMMSAAARESPIVAFMGTLQRQKRPDQFLRAAAIIHRLRADVRFMVFGRDGESGADLRQLTNDLNLSECVTFAGFRADAPMLLSGCDLLLAPAVNEGFGRVLVEAMIAGVPVIAAASGGHIEIVSHNINGILVTPDDPEGMATAALDLLDCSQWRRRLTEKARDWASVGYSVDEHTRRVVGFYQKSLELR